MILACKLHAWLVLALCLLLMLCSCASKGIKLSGGLGPNASFEYGGGETKSLLSNVLGSGGEAQPKPAPGTVVIAAGDNVRLDAHVQIGAPPVSTTTTISNQSPPGVSALLRDWLSDDDDDKKPEK